MNIKNSTIISRAINRTHTARHHVTFRLNQDSLDMLKDCMTKIEKSTEGKLSRGAVIRLLIDIHAELKQNNQPLETVTTLNKDTKIWLDQATAGQASLTLTEDQRITLRKLEFDIQQSDWNIAIDRNDTAQLLILSYGQHLKDNLPSPSPTY